MANTTKAKTAPLKQAMRHEPVQLVTRRRGSHLHTPGCAADRHDRVFEQDGSARSAHVLC